MIPTQLRCDFVRKARGKLVAVSKGGTQLREQLQASDGELEIVHPALVRDKKGELCARLYITFKVAAKRSQSDDGGGEKQHHHHHKTQKSE